ncbi:MAG: sugar MFS transporter [Alphaproteobacteria bacterium]|nr:sugar MFS transporter [Alphaproteobacteria bacterium]
MSAHEREAHSGMVARARTLTGLVVFLFFAWGFGTVLNDTLFPKLKGLYQLSYAQGMLTQFAFFTSYFVFSIPAGLLLARIGYVRGVVVGLLAMAAGCALFWPAGEIDRFGAFLVPLFVIAGGMTMLQVAANPFIELLGPAATSHSRLTLAQAFNSLATAIGPAVGAVLILRSGVGAHAPGLSPEAVASLRHDQTHTIALFYLAISAVLAAVALVFFVMRNAPAPPVPGQARLSGAFRLIAHPRLGFGAAAIFLYVGAEVSIGSLMTNYLMAPRILGASAEHAGALVSWYWGGAMVGRFIGAALLRRVRPGLLLAFCAIAASALALSSALSSGTLAAATLIGVGLFNSIQFPTIFSLASEGLGEETPNGSGLLCMAIVGGALVPLLAGRIADLSSLRMALAVPVVCYLAIALYGARVAKR